MSKAVGGGRWAVGDEPQNTGALVSGFKATRGDRPLSSGPFAPTSPCPRRYPRPRLAFNPLVRLFIRPPSLDRLTYLASTT